MSVEEPSSSIVFTKIENGTIFTSDFRSFTERNVISFSKEGMAVVYGPNGTGKTSLVRALSGDDGTSVEFRFNGSSYTSGKDAFFNNK